MYLYQQIINRLVINSIKREEEFNNDNNNNSLIPERLSTLLRIPMSTIQITLKDTTSISI